MIILYKKEWVIWCDLWRINKMVMVDWVIVLTGIKVMEWVSRVCVLGFLFNYHF